MLVVYSKVLVLRVGGQTADVTVMSVNSGMYQVCATVSVPDLGGNIIDDLLVEHFAAEFQRFVGHCSGLKNPGFFKSQPSGFFGFYWVFWTSRKNR